MKKALFTIFLSSLTFYLQAQNQISPQDCIGGIPVCNGTYSQSTSYSGYGNYNELQNNNDGCLSADPGEDNSVWYIITVTSPGLLEFNLTPNSSLTDYDWALWDITTNGCYSLFNYNTNTTVPYGPVRCNTSGVTTLFNPTGVTGMNTTACCASQGAGNTAAFSSALAVTTGQVFALCIDNWSNSTVGYTLDFTTSTAGVYDTAHPHMDTIGAICGPTDSISVNMSEAIRCASLDSNGSSFYITPATANVVAATGVSCSNVSATTTTIGIKLSAQLPAGNYVLHAQVGTDSNTVLDYCNNAELTTDSMPFTIVDRPLLNMPLFDTTCLYDSIQLNATPTNTAPGITYTYQWTPAQYINSLTAANPKAAPPVNTQYYVTVTQSGPGQCVAKDSTEAVILPNDFTIFNHDTTMCGGPSIQINASGSPFFTYTWTPVAGVSNPNILDPVVTPVVTTDYQITATFPGCPPMTHYLDFTITYPTSPLIVHQATCVGTPIQFNVTAAGSETYNYSWAPGTYLNYTNTPTPTATPSDSGDIAYLVTVAPTGTSGCDIFDSVYLHILPNDFAIYNHDSTLCPYMPIQINALGDSEFTYVWTPATGVSDPNILQPVITPDTSGTYTITASYPGCPNMVHQLNYTVQKPVADIITPDTAVCILAPVQLHATASVSPDGLTLVYNWSPAAGISDPTALQPTFFEQVPGAYQYFLTVTTPLGCVDTDSITINALQPVKLVLNPVDTTINYGSSIQLNASDAQGQALFYVWMPNNGSLSSNTIGNPIATPLDSVTYHVTGMNTYGCQDSGTVTILLNNGIPAGLPNAFSPNNDGLNDVFRIVNLNYQKLIDFRIFNRWGNVVFQTSDPTRGWDGTYMGVAQDMGTYNYMIQLILPDGTEKTLRGTVTLVR